MRISEVHGEETELTHEQVVDFVNLVDSKCGPYIQSLGGWAFWLKENKRTSYKYNLFRGMKASPVVGEKAVREGRKPMSTPMWIHREIDEWFFQRFGHPFRSNAMFAISQPSIAGEYGPEYVVFPQGNIMFCYSTIIQDLWSAVEEAMLYVETNVPHDTHPEEVKDLIIEEVMEVLDNGRYTDENMYRAIESGTEVMVACDKYYFLDWDVYLNQMIGVVEDALGDGILKR